MELGESDSQQKRSKIRVVFELKFGADGTPGIVDSAERAVCKHRNFLAGEVEAQKTANFQLIGS